MKFFFSFITLFVCITAGASDGIKDSTSIKALAIPGSYCRNINNQFYGSAAAAAADGYARDGNGNCYVSAPVQPSAGMPGNAAPPQSPIEAADSPAPRMARTCIAPDAKVDTYACSAVKGANWTGTYRRTTSYSCQNDTLVSSVGDTDGCTQTAIAGSARPAPTCANGATNYPTCTFPLKTVYTCGGWGTNPNATYYFVNLDQGYLGLYKPSVIYAGSWWEQRQTCDENNQNCGPQMMYCGHD